MANKFLYVTMDRFKQRMSYYLNKLRDEEYDAIILRRYKRNIALINDMAAARRRNGRDSE